MGTPTKTLTLFVLIALASCLSASWEGIKPEVVTAAPVYAKRPRPKSGITALASTCKSQTGADSTTCTWSSPLSAGSSFVCHLSNFSATATTFTLTDSSGDAGTTLLAATSFSAPNPAYMGISMVAKTTGTVTTAKGTATAGTGAFITLNCNAFTASSTPTADGKCTGTTSSGWVATLTCSSSITPSATDYFFGGGYLPSGTIVPPSGFTLGAANSSNLASFYVVSSAKTNFPISQSSGATFPGSLVGAALTVTPTTSGSGGPTITNLNPASGPAGTAVTITGTNFGSTQGTSTVTFNGTAATVTSWSATSLKATVPSAATTGNVVVTSTSNGVAFTVTTPPPTHTVTLTWTASTSSGVTGHNIYRSTTKGGPYTKIASVGTATNYTDSTVTAGTTYYYVTTAIASGLESAYSNESSASVPSTSTLKSGRYKKEKEH